MDMCCAVPPFILEDRERGLLVLFPLNSTWLLAPEAPSTAPPQSLLRAGAAPHSWGSERVGCRDAEGLEKPAMLVTSVMDLPLSLLEIFWVATCIFFGILIKGMCVHCLWVG